MWGLEYFSFQDLWSPLFMAFMMAVALLYTLIVGPWRERFAQGAAVPFKRQFAFLLAVLLLYLTQGGPLELLGHLMFSFHMTNMAISYVIVPPLLLHGIPAWLWRWMFGRAFWRPFRVFVHPLVSLFAFNLIFSLYHMPGNHDYIMTNYSVHTVYYIAMLVTAMLMWWHIHCPVEEWARLSPLWRLGYIFLNGLLLTPACVLIIFASSPLFGVYNDPEVWTRAMGYCVSGDPAALLERFKGGPAFFNLLTPRDDQQLGGIIMKLLQEFVNVGALYVVFMKWYRAERAKESEPTALGGASVSGRLNNV